MRRRTFLGAAAAALARPGLAQPAKVLFDEEVGGRVDESAGEPVRITGTVLHVGRGTTRPAARAMPGSASPSAGATS